MSIIHKNTNYNNNFSNIVYGNYYEKSVYHQYEFSKTNNNVSCTCIGIDNSTIHGIENYIDIVIESYLNDNNREFFNSKWYNDLKYTCTLYDSNNDNLWMISDNIGSTPLWYSFPNKNDYNDYNFIVTSDLILAYRLGFKFLTPLGAGQIICVDLHYNEIIKLYQWQSDIHKQLKYKDIENVEMYSFQMIASSFNVLSIYENINESSIEIDHIIPSSLLLDCAIQALGNKYYTRISKTLVSDSILPKSDVFNSIIKDIPDLRDIMTAVWSPKFIRVAADRWNFCANSKSKIIFSHDSGMFPRPLEVYFQNLFCSSLGIDIIYPFRSIDFQLKLWGTRYSHSYFHNVLNSLRDSFACDNYKPRSFSTDSSNVIDYELKASNRSHLAHLWSVANKHASADGYIVVVLATSGYSDLLQNFLCSATKVDSKHILVLTPNDDIADIARNSGVGVVISTKWENININITIADFGTLSYQELILFRTETVRLLLLLGLNPVVADIDAVWLEDPIELLRAERKLQSFDIAVTDDNGEVCGCFVALHNTPYSLTFWKHVSRLHRELLIKGRKTLESAREFSESEQKILTDLLLNNKYQKKLKVIVLSDSAFPSGYNFFNLRQTINHNDSRGKPVVVHNNYIIGKGMKKIRFVRYNLWNYDSHSKSLSKCSYDPLVLWSKVAYKVDKNFKIPILSLILPIHNSMITSSLLMAQAHTEGSLFNISSGLFWLEMNPPKFINFQTIGVYQLDVKKSNQINSLSIVLDHSNIAISADVGVNRSVFSFDRSGKAHEAANERVLKNKRLNTDGDNINSVNLKCSNFFCNARLNTSEADIDQSGNSNEKANILPLDISIKVLAYNRPLSLSRLLASLSNADLLGHSISLEIFVDGAVADHDVNLVEQVKTVARNFVWAYGSKVLTFRNVNYGLAKQWYLAWDPISSNEVAFIFEDDIVVSPYFFIWTYRVLLKYYVNDESQRIIQMLLLKAIENHIKNNGTVIENQEGVDAEFPKSIEDFVNKTAGEPLMYGVCLQKQHVDAPRYPKNLEIRNGHRPFLYSLIGSWGPLLLPYPWQAFRQWWIWALETGHDISTENTIVNHFHKNNPKIWTPWMVRFAFETGAKCLYPNLPGNLSLVTNHRERGENYDLSLGPDSKYLGIDEVDKVQELMIRMKIDISDSSPDSDRHRFVAETLSDRVTLALHYSINYLPSLTSLSGWQFDLNLRRAGSMSSDKLFTLDPEVARKSNSMKEFLMVHEQINQSKLFYQNAWRNDDDAILVMSNDHISEVMNLLEVNLLPGASFIHLGISPLLDLLIRQYPLHVVITNENHVILENDKNIRTDNKRVHLVHFDEAQSKLGGLPNKDFDIAVVHLPSLLNSSNNFPQFLSLLKYDYLLVLSNSCSGSPTDLHYMNLNGDSSWSYSLIEDVCVEADEDVGSSLFRRLIVGTEDEWYSNRYIVSRRIKTSSEILVTRRVITP